MNKKIIWIVALVIMLVMLGALCFGYYKNATMEIKNPIVTMEVENFGTIKIELYPEYAPETVSNFIGLINNGYYNNLTFHRVVADFMIQGGDINGDGTGGVVKDNILGDGDQTPYSIKGEFIANDVNNSLKFEKGVIGMARSDYTQSSSELFEESYNSGGSQFFIVTDDEDNTMLNGQYTSFGKVIEGMEVVEAISKVEVQLPEDSEETGDTEVSRPVTPVIIKNMTVDTFGINYELPELLETFDYMTWLYEQYGIDPSTMVVE